MKLASRPAIAALAVAALACLGLGSRERDAGPFFGAGAPGLSPERIAPELYSVAGFKPHGTLAFSPDGSEAYWGVSTEAAPMRFTIFTSRLVAGRWSEPREALLAGKDETLCPVFAPDGRRLYFHSRRAPAGAPETRLGTHIWYVERLAGGWSEPRLHPADGGSELSLAPARDGTIVVASCRDAPADFGFDLYRSAPDGDSFRPLERLGPEVDTARQELFPCLAPDGSWLVFDTDRWTDDKRWHLFVSFPAPGGDWTAAADLSAALGIPGGAYPSVSTDGTRLFFVGEGEAYFSVGVAAVERLRPGHGPGPGQSAGRSN